MTFYLNDKIPNTSHFLDWEPVPNPGSASPNTYCAVVSSVSALQLLGFDDDQQPDTTKDYPLSIGPSWYIEIHTVTDKFVKLTANTNGTCNERKGHTVSITSNSKDLFYPDPLGGKRHERRFKDSACVSAHQDEDMCERVASVIYEGKTYFCDAQDCRVLVGTPLHKLQPTGGYGQHRRRVRD